MGTDTRVRRTAAKLKAGRSVPIRAWDIDTGRPGPRLLLTAAQHGNEIQGSEAIRRFVDQYGPKLKAGKVTAIPFANPVALHDRRPHVNMRPEQPYAKHPNLNMNRTWPGRENGNDSERMAYAIYQAFGACATHVFDLHCWAKFTAPALLIRDRADLRGLAKGMGHRFVLIRAPFSPTVSGRFCASGRVGITYEFSGQYLTDERQIAHGLRLIVNLAKQIGMLGGPLLKGHSPVLFDDQTDKVTVKAPRDGLYVAADRGLCAPVSKGDLLGRLLSDKDLTTLDIVAPVSGYLYEHGAKRADCDVSLACQHPYARRGEDLAAIVVPG